VASFIGNTGPANDRQRAYELDAMKTLRQSDTNADVDALIRILLEQGFLRTEALPWFPGGGDRHLTYNLLVERAVIHFQQTHLGKHGDPLVPDGIVGPATWWALRSPSGPPQEHGIKPRVPSGLSDRRATCIQLLISEHALNVREHPNGSNRGPVDKYLPKHWLRKGRAGPPWCAFFVSYMLHQLFDHHPLGKREGSVRGMVKLAKELGMWRPEASYRPIPGDVFIMLHENGRTGHTGFVTAREFGNLNTCEGNAGNMVKWGLRSMDSMAGYINPYPQCEQWLDYEHFVITGDKLTGRTR